jgi:hypothetical protein
MAPALPGVFPWLELDRTRTDVLLAVDRPPSVLVMLMPLISDPRAVDVGEISPPYIPSEGLTWRQACCLP